MQELIWLMAWRKVYNEAVDKARKNEGLTKEAREEAQPGEPEPLRSSGEDVGGDPAQVEVAEDALVLGLHDAEVDARHVRVLSLPLDHVREEEGARPQGHVVGGRGLD